MKYSLFLYIFFFKFNSLSTELNLVKEDSTIENNLPIEVKNNKYEKIATYSRRFQIISNILLLIFIGFLLINNLFNPEFPKNKERVILNENFILPNFETNGENNKTINFEDMFKKPNFNKEELKPLTWPPV